MENELIRPIIRVGNSAGILLPKSWINNKAKVELIQESMDDISENTIRILKENELLQDIKGVYLTGSYARNEQTQESDIDILVITNKTNKRIKKGKYDTLLISREIIERKLKNNIMPILPMLKEAKVIINKDLIENYKKTPLTKKNLKWHIETTKSAINMNKAAIKLDKELELDKTGDATAYSLVLRLRGVYIINCLRNNRLWNTNELISLVKKISGSTIAYERYIYIKKGLGKSKDIMPIIEAEKLLDCVKKENLKQEKWLKEKRD
ncbi:MAG: nucleotidyltransferase domain-containing protein [Nanoarchaeota archaeon]